MLPPHTRRLTPDEWVHLLGLHAAIELRSNYSAYTTEERQAAAAPVIARNREIQRLWKDGVADGHLADVLGLTDDAIARARRQARALTGDTGRPRRLPTPPPVKPGRPRLSETERELLRAAYQRVRADGRDYRRSSHWSTLLRLMRDHRARRISVTDIAAALGISRRSTSKLLHNTAQ